MRAALVALCCLAVLSACGTAPATNTSPFSLRLRLALSRIAATADTRKSVSFDDTSRLARFAGTKQGYGDLRSSAAATLASYSKIIEEQPGIALAKADYTVTAGQPPKTVGVVAGGQDADKVTHGLTDLGWRDGQGHLTAPDPMSITDETLAPLALSLAKVHPEDADLIYGGGAANLDDADHPSGPTLADDPRILALAECLGDVVAARVETPTMLGKLHPTAIAVGVRAPARDTDTPHVVVCASWASADDATRYHTLLDKALREQASMVTATPWTEILAHPSSHDVGGDEHVVSFEADTPNAPASGILNMLNRLDLPAFPCAAAPARMTPAQRKAMADKFPGYC